MRVSVTDQHPATAPFACVLLLVGQGLEREFRELAWFRDALGGNAGCARTQSLRPRPRDDRVEAEMRVYIWCDGAAMPNGGPAGAGYVVVGGVHLLGSEALGDATNNVAEYTAVRNALRAAADAGATSAHVRMDSKVVFGHLSGASRARAEHLIQFKEKVEAQVARYPGRVTFARIDREQNGVADEFAKDGARASKALSADRRR
jgi:ribonuclease HI